MISDEHPNAHVRIRKDVTRFCSKLTPNVMLKTFNEVSQGE
jgi:hypothetical protein